MKKGFTLIELLIVIAIIGILAVALLPTVLGAPARGRDAARKGYLDAIMTSIEAWNLDGNGYTLGASLTTAGPVCIGPATSLSGTQKPNTNFITKYLQGGVQPGDPSGTAAPQVGICAKGDFYFCQLSGANNQNYILASTMEMDTNANAFTTVRSPDDSKQYVFPTTACGWNGTTAPSAVSDTIEKPTSTDKGYVYVLVR